MYEIVVNNVAMVTNCLRVSVAIPYTGCFTTCGHYCRRWFPRSVIKKVHINMCPILDGYGVTTAWNLE